MPYLPHVWLQSRTPSLNAHQFCQGNRVDVGQEGWWNDVNALTVCWDMTSVFGLKRKAKTTIKDNMTWRVYIGTRNRTRSFTATILANAIVEEFFEQLWEECIPSCLALTIILHTEFYLSWIVDIERLNVHKLRWFVYTSPQCLEMYFHWAYPSIFAVNIWFQIRDQCWIPHR